MTLWQFATTFYSQPGVAPACLALQDRHAVDVNQLMFAAWAGLVSGARMSPRDCVEAAQHVQAWREQVVGPLREVRRRMKDDVLSSFHPASLEMRERVKGLELHAEKLQLQALETWAASRIAENATGAGVASALENLNVFLQSQVPVPAEIEPAVTAALREGLQDFSRWPG